MAAPSLTLRFTARRASRQVISRCQSSRFESTTSAPTSKRKSKSTASKQLDTSRFDLSPEDAAKLVEKVRRNKNSDPGESMDPSKRRAQGNDTLPKPILTGGRMARLMELEAQAQSNPDWRARAELSPLAEAGLGIPTLPGFKKVKPSELYLKREEIRENRVRQEEEMLKSQGLHQSWNDLSKKEQTRLRKGDPFPRNTDDGRLPDRVKSGFMNMGVKRGAEDFELEDPEFQGDDITSMAHGQLEEHREFRQYARIAAWEMPLLTRKFQTSYELFLTSFGVLTRIELAKEFKPPKEGQFLRFRYTHYMGEQHPAEKKVVVEFSAADLTMMTSAQVLKLKKLVGARYNPQTDIIKMSCEMFETPAQNKRFLCDTIEKLFVEAKDPTDDFADVPLDLRHHKFKHPLKFPEAWKLTPDRKAELASYREQVLQIEEDRQVQGLLVDGVKEISAAHARIPAPELAQVHEMAMAGKGKGKAGGQKRVLLRR